MECDKSCPKFQDKKFCNNVTSATVKYELLESYLAALSKVKDITVTKVASRNVSQSAVIDRKKQNIPRRK